MFIQFCKLIALLLLLSLCALCIATSPMWYTMAKKWHKERQCAVDIDCMKTNFTSNMCTNEYGLAVYRAKDYSPIERNYSACQCSDYIVTKICTKK